MISRPNIKYIGFSNGYRIRPSFKTVSFFHSFTHFFYFRNATSSCFTHRKVSIMIDYVHDNETHNVICMLQTKMRIRIYVMIVTKM